MTAIDPVPPLTLPAAGQHGPLDEARLRSLFESVVVNANDVVLVTEAEPVDLPSGGPRVIYVNPAFTRMTGYAPHEIVGRTPRILQSPKTDRRELDRLRDALRRWRPVEVELLNVHKDGREFWVQISITPVADADGWYTHWVAIQRDVTARKHHEFAVQAMLANSSDLVLTLDATGRLISVSPSSQRLLGRAPDALAGLALLELVHPDDVRTARELLRPTSTVRLGRSAVAELRLSHVDGGWRWAEVSAADLGEHFPGSIVLACSDVTARKDSEAALRRADDRFRSAFHDAPIGMAVTEPDGRFVQVNAALARLLGRTEDDLLTARVQDVMHADDVEPGERQRQALLHGSITRHRHETRFVHADGSVVGVLHSSSLVPGPDGRPRHLVDHVEDITDRKAFEAQLRHQALHDPLTGLPNRALLADRLERALRTGRPLAVLFLDLDRFKVVNDSLGHAAGDVVLVDVAARIERVLRAGDSVARFGGDEFVVLCIDCTPDQAASTAERVAAALRAPVTVADTEVVVGVSVGIGLPKPGVSAEDLLREADAAMYSAKDLGRGRFEVYDEVVGARAAARRRLEGELRVGIATGQLRLHYQPEVRLADGVVVGLEALVRWQHPARGLLHPEDFIDLAEETGLVVQLGEWVLDTAVAEAAALQAQRSHRRPPVVWVNLSASQLAEPTFVDGVAHRLATHGLPAYALGLEITESVLVREADGASGALTRLRALGVGLAIDDFGTGYSSLSYLARFPVDTVKIDRTFITGLDDDERRRECFAVVSAVVGLAHALRLRVVAEGVETRSQADALHGLGCDTGQGWLLGRPAPHHAAVLAQACP